MASEEIKLTKNVHSEALSAQVSDKKKGGKFQPFKKLFGKKKKKNTLLSEESAGRQRQSHAPWSASDGTLSSDEETLENSLRSFNFSMGVRAFSHDSIFIPDGGAENEQTVQAMSQDNILGKVKTLQRQLGKNIKFGQRPSNAIPMKKAGSVDASSDEDFFLTSPMEIVTQQDIVLSDTENKSSDTPSSSSPLNLPEAGSEMEEKVAPVKPSRPKRQFSSGTIESVNLDAIPLAIARLDNSAAKHKLSVKPKNQRVSRKHRWLTQDRQNVPGSFESQSSLDLNGQPGEDKHICHEEEPEPLDSHEDKRLQEEYWQELEAKCKRQKAEAAEKRRLEEQKRQALERRLWEENLRQKLLEEEEGEEEDLQLEAGKAPPRLRSGPEKQGCAEQELREADAPASLESEESRCEQEEAETKEEKLRHRDAQRQEEELMQREAERQVEKLRQEEELKQLEAQKQEEKLRQLEAERREEELRQLEAQKQEEKLRQLEAERQEEELRKLEAQKQEERLRQLEAERQHAQEEEEETRRMLQELRQEEEEEVKLGEEMKWRAMQAPGPQVDEDPQGPEEESQPRLSDHTDQGPLQRDLENPEEQENLESAGQKEMAPEQKEEARTPSEPAEQRGDLSTECGGVDVEGREATQMDILLPQEEQTGGKPASEDKNEAVAADNDRKVEELRWQEVDERQTMPRPYTFQVTSGGKQILFPKVNLSPVTPAKDSSLAPVAQEPPVPRGAAPHALPSALSIPHTAILVTGAQLCGPAVNLSQIKDTACKSLLGLSEEKRPADVPAVEARSSGSKVRPPPESPSNAAALAEWACIRSRILKNAEGDQRGDREPARVGDEPAPRARCDSRGNVRRTPPANAKFSIMPAWQKFSDGGGVETFRQSLDGESGRKRPGPAPGEETAPQPSPAAAPEPPDTTDGCKFAKDLPSFLVPGLPSPQKAAPRTGSTASLDSESTSDIGKSDLVVPGSEEKASPFGIKLRRTNYSLRFHCDQQAEQKKKKRHSSTGDTVDGGTPAAGSGPAEKEPEVVALKPGTSLPQEKKPVLAPRRDSAERPPSGDSVAVAQPGLPPAGSQTPVPEQDKAASKTPPMQKPALAPKPTSQTPPSSPLSKLSKPHLVELLARRAGKVDSELGETRKESSDNQLPSPSLPQEPKGPKKNEEEVPEKKPASPPLSASQQERPSLTPETGRKEKPMLQSRHSLDGSKLTEKVETAQPLWITLALQKQKGFREQQATREERKQAREAKQAEKLSKETASVSPHPGSSRGSRAGSLHKSATPEEKKPETAVSRLQRREQLKKANTLPTSVTVEISDSAPAAPLVKEAPKRFSTPDAAPVSTEPAWLALAKRKAKAWSDCPQIIK
ncbi:capping protein-inhibiting regulator of actin dynamics isoform X2 [Phodopus roborovskii]|uniref:capping protein-inhibiting regulator of actin dynamics isoform X2 n=1 Tax=Phodopus roborovskii TaxID=109678 RepID=UPI0021E3BF53|nr:capping protein-inhibiting regulator of actin dynamics isoform X2 [Phodopus roborovskii]